MDRARIGIACTFGAPWSHIRSVVSCGVQFETKSNLDLLSYLRYCHLRVEEIPLEEVALKPDQAVVRVSHFHKVRQLH
jgi:hypothetical protein